jgi:hypothetical protein
MGKGRDCEIARSLLGSASSFDCVRQIATVKVGEEDGKLSQDHMVLELS